jgi:hypothetical protein
MFNESIANSRAWKPDTDNSAIRRDMIHSWFDAAFLCPPGYDSKTTPALHSDVLSQLFSDQVAYYATTDASVSVADMFCLSRFELPNVTIRYYESNLPFPSCAAQELTSMLKTHATKTHTVPPPKTVLDEVFKRAWPRLWNPLPHVCDAYDMRTTLFVRSATSDKSAWRLGMLQPFDGQSVKLPHYPWQRFRAIHKSLRDAFASRPMQYSNIWHSCELQQTNQEAGFMLNNHVSTTFHHALQVLSTVPWLAGRFLLHSPHKSRDDVVKHWEALLTHLTPSGFSVAASSSFSSGAPAFVSSSASSVPSSLLAASAAMIASPTRRAVPQDAQRKRKQKAGAAVSTVPLRWTLHTYPTFSVFAKDAPSSPAPSL